jgi:hypothetical protein
MNASSIMRRKDMFLSDSDLKSSGSTFVKTFTLIKFSDFKAILIRAAWTAL